MSPSRAELIGAEPRFWSRVPQGAGCWEWVGYRNQKGYGVFGLRAGRTMLAHRTTYTLAVGEIPANVLCLHRCDNPACVRPDHLFFGSHQDNKTDSINKGRLRIMVGSKNGRSKLTTADVNAAKRMRAEGVSFVALGRRFGVSDVAIAKAIRGETWREFEDDIAS